MRNLIRISGIVGMLLSMLSGAAGAGRGHPRMDALRAIWARRENRGGPPRAWRHCGGPALPKAVRQVGGLPAGKGRMRARARDRGCLPLAGGLRCLARGSTAIVANWEGETMRILRGVILCLVWAQMSGWAGGEGVPVVIGNRSAACSR
jgi:hypothetical protein